MKTAAGAEVLDFEAQLRDEIDKDKNIDLDRACSEIVVDKLSIDEEQIHKDLDDYDLKNYRGMNDDFMKNEEFARKALELGIDEKLLIEQAVANMKKMKVNDWIKEGEDMLEEANNDEKKAD